MMLVWIVLVAALAHGQTFEQCAQFVAPCSSSLSCCGGIQQCLRHESSSTCYNGSSSLSGLRCAVPGLFTPACNTVLPAPNVAPPSNAQLLFTLDSRGYRYWDCYPNGTVISGLVDAWAVADTATGWHSGFVYETRDYSGGFPGYAGQKIAVFPFAYVTNTTAAFGEYWLADATFGPAKPNGDLVDGRWRLVPVFETTMRHPLPSYLIRRNSIGGATPTSCPPGLNYIRIPYETKYDVYTCGATTPAVTSVPSYPAGATASCPGTQPNNTLTPPAGSTLLAKVNIKARNVFDCRLGFPVRVLRIANVTVSGGWSGVLRFAGGIAMVDLTRTVGNTTSYWYVRWDLNDYSPGAEGTVPNTVNTTVLGGTLRRFRITFAAQTDGSRTFPCNSSDQACLAANGKVAWHVHTASAGAPSPPQNCSAAVNGEIVIFDETWADWYTCVGAIL